MIRKHLTLVLVMAFLVGCTVGCTAPSVPSATEATSEPAITITGGVADVSPGARLIVLAEPVEGFEIVVLAEDAELLAADGSDTTLAEMQPGTTIEATGRSGGTGAMIVTRLRVIAVATAVPTATSAADEREIVLESPQNGETIFNPVEVRGRVSVTPFEGTLRVRITDAQGQVVGEAPITVDGEMGQPGTFAAQIAFSAASGGPGEVEVAEVSAEDGSVVANASADVVLPGPSAITITGVVTSVSVSPRVITLVEPVEGLIHVALIEETGITLADGGAGTLEDVEQGMTIQAIGQPSGAGALDAAQIRILGAGTPMPTVVPTVPPPEIQLMAPQEGEIVPSPVEIRGSIRVTPFEATLVARIIDTQGQMVSEAPFMVDGELGEPGTFTASISYVTPTSGPATVEVVDISARDGSVVASASVIVTLIGTPDVTIVGTVEEVLPSARLIMLTAHEDGFGVVALTEETALTTADGSAATLWDIQPGREIQVSGQPGVSDTLIATTVRMLEAYAQDIVLEAPRDGETVSSPIELRGTVRIMPFEGTLNARVYDAQGQIIGEMPFMVDGEIGGPGIFTALIGYDAPSGGPGGVEVVEFSARDGSIVASTSVDVVLSSGTSEVTIVGAVSEVFARARVIVLVEAVDGFSVVALDGETEILSADGTGTTIQEIQPGMRIQVSGRPSGADTLVASQVRIWGEE